MNTDEKLLEAVRSMQKSVNNLEAVIVEQIRSHAVVTAETKEPELTELPKLWYVENYDKSREWAIEVGDFEPVYDFVCFDDEGINSFISSYSEIGEYTHLTREQFERLVYNPWKESLKTKQFDPNTADRTKFYRAWHKNHGEGVVRHNSSVFHFENHYVFSASINNCTHIDANPIDMSDIPEYKHVR